MPGRGESGNRGARRPPGRGRGGRPPTPGDRPVGGGGGGGNAGNPPGRQPTPPRRPGGLNVRRIGGNDFELTHPKCVQEMELDFEEGLEIWKAGDPDGARDALRYALQGCGDNIWVHVALGRIALQEFNDPALARGHFGYAYELANRAVPPGFQGRLPKDRPANRPFFDAIDGLAICYEALGKPAESADLRRQASALAIGRHPQPRREAPDAPPPPAPKRPGPDTE